MRKVKKINGYLIVKFNDRERREWEQLGAYGIIDAELYTGTLEVDRGVMEYDDAETLEVAMEQARALESELDVEEPERKFSVTVETEAEVSEEEVDPQLLIAGWTTDLEQQIKSGHYPGVTPTTARHELYGFKVALRELGLLDSGECYVLPDTFGPEESPLPKEPEELLAHICDEVCKERIPGRTQEALDAVCARCAVERLASEADDRELRLRSAAMKELNDLIDELRATPLNTKAERLEHEAGAYLRALVVARVVTDGERVALEAAINDAAEARPYAAERASFEHLHPNIRRDPTAAKIYAMGLVLSGDCPDNDCRVFLNIFKMARELDAALDEFSGNSVPALALRRELRERFGELVEMYHTNYAVQKFKEGMKP